MIWNMIHSPQGYDPSQYIGVAHLPAAVQQHAPPAATGTRHRQQPTRRGRRVALLVFGTLQLADHRATAAAERVRHPGLKVSTLARTKHLGWYVEFEFRVTHGLEPAGRTCAAISAAVPRSGAAESQSQWS